MTLGPGESRPNRVAERYLGERTSVAGATLLFDQIDLAANVAPRAISMRSTRRPGRSRA